jgi:hypothetical protein
MIPSVSPVATGNLQNLTHSTLTSLFRRGIRRLQACPQRLLAPPPLWAAWLN